MSHSGQLVPVGEVAQLSLEAMGLAIGEERRTVAFEDGGGIEDGCRRAVASAYPTTSTTLSSAASAESRRRPGPSGQDSARPRKLAGRIAGDAELRNRRAARGLLSLLEGPREALDAGEVRFRIARDPCQLDPTDTIGAGSVCRVRICRP